MATGAVAERVETVESAPITLLAAIQSSTIDRDARTVEVVFYSGAPMERFDWDSGRAYLLTLALEESAVRLGRLNNGAPLLDAHGSYSIKDQVGVIEAGSAKVGRRATATVRFSRRAEVEPIWQDVQDGIIRNVSVGARIYKYEQADATDTKPMKRHAVDWEPFEISLVPMGADPGAQIKAADNAPKNRCIAVLCAAQEERPMPDETKQDEQPRDAATVAATATATATDPRDPTDPGAPIARPPVETTERKPSMQQLAAEAERARVQGILRAARNAGLEHMADEMIANGTSLIDASTKFLDLLGQMGNQDRGPRVGTARAELRTEPVLHVRAGIENALLHRVSPELFRLDDVGRLYAGGSLLDLAKVCLQARGIRTTGMSRMEVAGLALGLNVKGALHTTSDFADILADVANKTLRRAYDEAPQTFTAISRRVELPDFKPVRRVQLGEAPQLAEVLEHGEFTRGTIGNARETYQLRTFGKVFGITRQALVNDDTDAFSRVSILFGRAARTLESNLVWEQITSNPTMGDSVALFNSAHNNISGAAAAISVTTLGAGRASMRNQKGLDGVELLNITPRYLIVPPALETVADQNVATVTPAQSSNVNPFSGRLTVIAEPRLEAVSATVWYLAASPDQIDMVEYGFLAGEAGPVIESRVGFDVDGLEIKVRHDVAAKVIDWRGFFRNAA